MATIDCPVGETISSHLYDVREAFFLPRMTQTQMSLLPVYLLLQGREDILRDHTELRSSAAAFDETVIDCTHYVKHFKS
jgi:hypothetical protein